jgi:hypothetical protein
MYLANLWPPLRARLRRTLASLLAPLSHVPVPALPQVFVVVEGQNDIEFLRRMSTMLHAVEPRLPDLAAMEQRGELIFVPCGGGDSRSWAYPDDRQRAKIWPIYLQMFGLDPQQLWPKDHCWTGAEIRQCCENAALLGLPLVEAAKYVIPVSISGAEENEELRQWAGWGVTCGSTRRKAEPPTMSPGWSASSSSSSVPASAGR